jgi:hypothetical protein
MLLAEVFALQHHRDPVEANEPGEEEGGTVRVEHTHL